MEGREAEVAVRAEGGRLVLEMEGRRLEADFHPLPDGEVWSLLVDGRSIEVRVAPGAGNLDVAIQSTHIPVEVRHPLEKLLAQSERSSGAGAGETVAAPMPGLVVAIRVQPGDRVAPGQPVAVVEAMKMQNELLARVGGVVSEVLVAERATVSAGQALVRLLPEGAA
jgi:biotin carboxyl carrier protein